MSIRIYLAGRVTIEVNGTTVIDERQLRGKQGWLVFGYLVCERTRPVSREELAMVVWGDDLSPSWEGALSALLSRLGVLLSGDLLRAEGVSLSRAFGQYQLHLPAGAWIDMEAGASALDRAEARLRMGQPGSLLGPATVAATVARRPFLSGVNGFWAESQRNKLNRQLLRALDCLYENQVATGEVELAVEAAIEAIPLDPYRERAHRYLMQGGRQHALTHMGGGALDHQPLSCHEPAPWVLDAGPRSAPFRTWPSGRTTGVLCTGCSTIKTGVPKTLDTTSEVSTCQGSPEA